MTCAPLPLQAILPGKHHETYVASNATSIPFPPDLPVQLRGAQSFQASLRLLFIQYLGDTSSCLPPASRPFDVKEPTKLAPEAETF